MFGINKKEKIDSDLELYKKRKLLDIEKELEYYRSSKGTDMLEFAMTCYKELGEYEHTYHFAKEEKGIELAKIEASIEAKKELLATDKNAYERMLKMKDDEINRLNEVILRLIDKPASDVTVNSIK